MQQGLVSIVITCFNEERFIAEAVESARKQTYGAVEIIVVDDGSSDSSVDVVTQVASDARLVLKANGGLSSARNAGLEQIEGEYVVFLDGDDILKPSFAQSTVDALRSHPDAAYAYTQFEFFGRERRISEFPEFSVAKLVDGNYISATSTIRRVACNGACFDEKLRNGWEDWDFFLGLAERGQFGVRVDEPLLLYRKHEDRSRISDRLYEGRARQQTRLRIMRRHLRMFGIGRYAHHLASYAKMRVFKLFNQAND